MLRHIRVLGAAALAIGHGSGLVHHMRESRGLHRYDVNSSLPAGMPAGWTYRGCWVDSTHDRVLPAQLPDSQQNTPAACASACQAAGHAISGTEFGMQCFCGNTTSSPQAADSDCSQPCPGDASQKCGAGDRLTVWALGVPAGTGTASTEPATAQTTGPGTWSYHGCVSDNVNKQTLRWAVPLWETTLTPRLCQDRCAAFGYMAAGLEFGSRCFCGDPADVTAAGAGIIGDSACNLACVGAPGTMCGGANALSTFFWTGTPLYKWSYPQNATQAGRFDFLASGPTVPLMTIETITGKVSFLSKGPNTGLANETGAYELDPSTGAFRPLHVKTDVFCAAGLVLPDNVGRQLTLGGAYGSSTQATRLYWPTGSAGVWGTNDWQENREEVSLLASRWYASAMMLANGSILVVGGQQCANCAATPSLEVLPPTGAKEPMFLDWLARTNPNNLYPFLATLPSGGIFVGYFNEARVLDPKTFATVRTLPNMPGSVADDVRGGRTYPQQGAMVLLPQRAPFTDPLGVLICGGSTVESGDALDSCISTTPDAPNATWSVERLPAGRVMPCVVGLPDGTFLMVNGAVHGFAGFGLASEGAYDALLYDPAQPVGSRITVAANTTIKRLYHNEAITLLDGRVLISGSDPTGTIEQTPDLPEEYRVETFSPPYLLSGQPRPTFVLDQIDWNHGQAVPFTLGQAPRNGPVGVTLLGAVSSTHSNGMGARMLMPAVACVDRKCTVTAPPGPNVAPPGWYQFFVLDGGIPAVGVYVRIGGDPAGLGNWPAFGDFKVPGMGPVMVNRTG